MNSLLLFPLTALIIMFITFPFPVLALTADCQSTGSCSCYSSGETCYIDSDCLETYCGYSCPSLSHAYTIGNTCIADESHTCWCSASLGCNGGSCSCTISGTCTYSCYAGYDDCDASSDNGCECSRPAACCGGSGSNTRYYACDICVGFSCATCGAASCLSQNCGQTTYCSGGSCVSCSAGTANCDQNAANGCEVNTNTDLNNCGSCGNVCPDSYGSCGEPTCSGGSCGNTAYSSGQYTGCTGTTGCTDDGIGQKVCACNGTGGCTDSCGDGSCQSWENSSTCTSDCNVVPTISSVTDSPDPANAGTDVNFSVDWSDGNPGEQVKIHICKNNTITNATQTCDGGSWCDSSSFTTNDPASCNYTTQISDAGTTSYYAFVCDDSNACSSSMSGSFTVNAAPSIASVSDTPDPARAGSSVNFSVDWSDPNPGEQVKIHICKTNSLSGDVVSGYTCTGGSWCDSAGFTANDPESCGYTTSDADHGVKTYYAFVCDDGGLCSSSTSGTFTVLVRTGNITIKLTLEGTSNSVYIPGTGVVAAGSLGSQTFANPSYRFLASYLNDVLYGLAGAYGTNMTLAVSNTSSNHSLTLEAGMDSHKILLIFTRGDWRNIWNAIPLLEAGSFLSQPSPSFGYGLAKVSDILIMLAYTYVDLLGTKTYHEGGMILYAQNINDSGGKTVINVTR